MTPLLVVAVLAMGDMPPPEPKKPMPLPPPGYTACSEEAGVCLTRYDEFLEMRDRASRTEEAEERLKALSDKCVGKLEVKPKLKKERDA